MGRFKSVHIYGSYDIIKKVRVVKAITLGLIVCGVLAGQLISFSGLWLEGGHSNREIERRFNEDWERAAKLSHESGIPFYLGKDQDDPHMWAYEGKSITPVDYVNVHGIPFIFAYRHEILGDLIPDHGNWRDGISATTWIFDGAEILEIRILPLAANLLIGFAVVWAASLMILTEKYSRIRPFRFSSISAVASTGCFVWVWMNREFYPTNSAFWELSNESPFGVISAYQLHCVSILVLWAARFATLVGPYCFLMVVLQWTAARYSSRSKSDRIREFPESDRE